MQLQIASFVKSREP